MASTSTSEAFPGFNNLYELNDVDPYSRNYRVALDLKGADSSAVLRGEVDVPGLSAAWAMGGESPGEVVATMDIDLALLRSSVVDMLTEEGFSGWSATLCQLERDPAVAAGSLYLLSVTGRCGPIQHAKSETLMTRYPAGFFPCRRGVYFDPSTWDGADFFIPVRGYNAVIVTERVKDAFEKRRIRNIGFTALNVIEIPMEIPWGDA